MQSAAPLAHVSFARNDIDEAELLGEQLDEEAIRVNRLLARYAVRSASNGHTSIARMAAGLGGAGLVEIRNDEVLIGALLSKAGAQRLHRQFLVRASRSMPDLASEIRELTVR